MRKIIAALALCSSTTLFAQDSTPTVQTKTVAKESQDVVIEIFRIAPGKHREFLEAIASYDEVNRRAGLPPRQLYVHQTGAAWDFMLIQPAKTPDANREALDKAWEDMNMPSGPDFFFTFRSMIAEHNDTFASAPTTAAAYLASAAKE